MPSNRICRWLPVLPGGVVGTTSAAPIEGEFATNAAAVLVVLGVLAILLGIRNLRALRHKQALPLRQPEAAESPTQDSRMAVRSRF